MRNQQRPETTGYAGKNSGIVNTYKIIARFTTDEGVERVRLESFGANPIQFWVDKSKLCDPPRPIRKPNEQLRTCWECGGDFTWRECQHDGGDWNENYCGC